MNNMLEYMTGGQCYNCGGKVRYADGGEADPSAVANMSGMQMGQQPKKQGPSVLEANADQLLKFLKQQLEKGTSSRILKKTLLDSGLKAEEADSILRIAQEEFDKDFSDNQDQMAQQQAAMAQATPGMMQPTGQQPAVGAGDDPSVMAMNNQGQQSQMTDEQMMMQQGRYGGSMRKLSRMNMGGTCPEGFMWDDMSGSCRPSAVTANLMTQGAGPVNTAQQTTQNNVSQPNYNAIQNAHAAKVGAESNMYANMLDSYKQKKTDAKGVTQQFVGNAYANIRNGQTPFQALGLAPAPQPAVVPQPVGRFGGLHKFVNAGTVGGCPEGYYAGPDGDCLKIFGSDQSQKQYQDYVNWYGEDAPAAGQQRGPQQTFNEWSKENPAQDKMNLDLQNAEKKQKYQGYVNWYNETPTTEGYNKAAHQTYDEWEKENYSTEPEKVNDPSAPVDPRTTNNPYITYTDKNKIANLDANFVNKGLAVANLMGDARTGAGLLPSEGFGSGLKFILGATAAIGGAGLTLGKFLSKDKTRTYDDKGNVFYGNPAKQSNDPSAPVETGRRANDDNGTPLGVDENGALVSYNPKPTVRRVKGMDVSDRPVTTTNPATLPAEEEGGEYNPFLDKRPRFMVTRPVYSLGGETTPYDFAKWAELTGNNPNDINNPSVKSSYDAYVQSFGPAANNQNTNNALSNNPNADKVNTKEYTSSTGDPLGFQVASNTYNGAVMMNDAAAGWAQEKQMDNVKVRGRRMGNSMESAVAINPVNPYGSMYAPNAGPGANQALATQGSGFDVGTSMNSSKYGGTKDYKKGGTYFLSQEDIDRIIAMGGEVEFLD